MKRAALACALLAAGCAAGPDYRRPPVAVPDSYRATAPPPAGESFGDAGWTSVYTDSKLRDLIAAALRNNPELAAVYEPLLTSREYDPELKPATTKAGITAGMSMTEKQGGSDVRANTTSAARTQDGTYRITGHKWFTSAPMGDLFMVLAQIRDKGLSCFLLPRVLPDGTRCYGRLEDADDLDTAEREEIVGRTVRLRGSEGGVNLARL